MLSPEKCKNIKETLTPDIKTQMLRTEQDNKEHGFVICENYTADKICDGEDRQICLSTTGKCKSNIGTFHTHPPKDTNYHSETRNFSRLDLKQFDTDPNLEFQCLGIIDTPIIEGEKSKYIVKCADKPDRVLLSKFNGAWEVLNYRASTMRKTGGIPKSYVDAYTKVIDTGKKLTDHCKFEI